MTSFYKTTKKTVSERIAALVRARSPGDMPAGSLAAAYKAAHGEPLRPQAYGKEKLGELLEELAAHPAAGFRTFRPPGKTHLVLKTHHLRKVRQPLATLRPMQVQMAGGASGIVRTTKDVLRAKEQRAKRAMMSAIIVKKARAVATQGLPVTEQCVACVRKALSAMPAGTGCGWCGAPHCDGCDF